LFRNPVSSPLRDHKEVGMTSHAIRHGEAITLQRCAAFLNALANTVSMAATRLNTWLESRRGAVSVRRHLGEMSDRELRDIGLTRFDIEDVAKGRFAKSRYGDLPRP
jgi:uncharacterized protein YjiS (DUF1127 family)